MSPGKEFDRQYMLLTQATQHDYGDLCRIDVLGLADTAEHDQGSVYEEFKEQLVRSSEGWYETGLPWRGNHPPLPSNKEGSLRRLDRLVKKLDRQGITTEHNQIIEEQKRTGIIELAPDPPTGQEFYLPHKPVVDPFQLPYAVILKRHSSKFELSYKKEMHSVFIGRVTNTPRP